MVWTHEWIPANRFSRTARKTPSNNVEYRVSPDGKITFRNFRTTAVATRRMAGHDEQSCSVLPYVASSCRSYRYLSVNVLDPAKLNCSAGNSLPGRSAPLAWISKLMFWIAAGIEG